MIVLLKGGYHVDSYLMLSAFKFGVKKSVGYIAGKSRADNTLTKADNIGIVVHFCKTRTVCIGAGSCPYSFVLVCGDRHTDTRSANENTRVAFTRYYFFTDRMSVNRVVTAFLRVGSDIYVFYTSFGEMLHNCLLERISRMIRADHDWFFGVHIYIPFPALPI